MESVNPFPATHFPRQVRPSWKKTAEFADGYGCFHAADLASDCGQQPELTDADDDDDDSTSTTLPFRFQYNHGKEKWRLEADEPTLPLLPPPETCSIALPTFLDLTSRTRMRNTRHTIQDRAPEQAIYLYNKYPQLIWGSALDFLHDSYTDHFSYRKRKGIEKLKKLQEMSPFVSLNRVRSDGNIFNLVDHLEPALYDINPNMLINLLKEEINDTIHKQYVDEDLYGGCLAYQPLKSSSAYEGLLFYPTGPTLETLNIRALPHQDVPIYSIRESPSQHFAVSMPLRQVETVSVPHKDSVLVGLRTDYSCCIMKVVMKGKKIKGQVMNLVRSQQKLASVALSPYIYGECVLGLSTGGIQLIDPKKGPSIVQESPDLENQSARWCHYGGHPRQIVSLQRDRVDLVDTRTPARSKSCCLLSLPGKELPPDQKIFVARQHPSNHFYHFVATQNLLLLLDERFPKYNVLQWNHALATPPSFMDIVPQALTSADLVAVGSQCSREVHCIQCNSLNGQMPESTSQPWKVSSTDGWFSMLPKYPAADLDPVRSRLERPLIGVSAARRTSHQGGEPGVTVFQLSSAGDLFYQTYCHKSAGSSRDKTLSFGLGCPSVQLTPESLASCTDWVDGVLRQEAGKTKKDVTCGRSEQVDALLALKAVKLMTKTKTPVPACKICNMSGATQPPEPLKSSATHPACPACGVTVTDGTELKRRLANQGETVLHKRAADDEEEEDAEEEDVLRRLNPRMYTDEMSKALHHAWVHGYEDGDEDVVDDGSGHDSSDEDLTMTKISPLRRPAATPRSNRLSLRRRRPSTEELTPTRRRPEEPSQSLDTSSQPRAADSQRTPSSSMRLSQTSTRKKPRRSAIGF